MSTYEEINENLTAQICELEALQSVYPKELVITDHGVLADINNFIKNPMQELPQRLEYSIGISMNGGTIELLISLSSNYPKQKPEVYVRSSSLNRTQQLLLNQALSNVVEHQEEEEPCIYMLISWLQDNSEDYLAATIMNQRKESNNSKQKEKQEKSRGFARYWIYSHHIYSKIKRRNVATLAKENSITGFCLAGKPGIICMEGAYNDCDYCWQKIKSMNWHKILVKLLEKEEDCKDIDIMRKFNNFQEISFPVSECSNDMSQMLKYLIEHKSQYAFKQLFGIEGRLPELLD
ncbi:PREDICTED: RWD domain-containing protein 2A [Habropoda laboriosa]|uniref:RWD domain-containing protein 2A n=1 Tax=Habropoda laboriosa TaxID=597456 RepID=UPI00083D9254|nr:PREDICTED: RWD domain-containing protein 2A [Habropoda laboriosa]